MCPEASGTVPEVRSSLRIRSVRIRHDSVQSGLVTKGNTRMARRLTTLLVSAGAAVLAAGVAAGVLAAPAGAINTYNASPAPERTETGALLVLWDTDGDGVDDSFDWHCSGAMIDRDTFLTASHCIVDWSADPALDHFYVSLDQDVQGELDAAAALGLSGTAEAGYFVAHGLAVEGTRIADAGYRQGQARPHHHRRGGLPPP